MIKESGILITKTETMDQSADNRVEKEKGEKESLEEKIAAIPARLIAPYTIPALIKGFDFFNQLSEAGPQTVDDLAERLNVDKRVLGVVVNYLSKEGYVEETDDSRYKLSLAAEEFLTREAKYDLSKFAQVYEECVPKGVGNAIISALRTGQPAKWQEGESWTEGLKSGSLAKVFSEGVMSRGKLLADKLSVALKEELSVHETLVDIGGSLGDYCGKFAQDYPNLSCIVFDLPKVIENTEKNIVTAGYQRVGAMAGDMFEDEFPKNIDIHFYSSVLHDWSPEQVAVLLKKSFDSLESGGLAIIHDVHLNNDKKSPNFAVDHSLAMAIQTEGRCYSYQEVEEMLKQAGFNDVKIKKTVAGYSAIIAQK